MRATELAIGQVRIVDGVPSLITDGQYLDSIYGRVSNFWYWRPIRKDGTLGRTKCGYGGEQFGKLLPHTLVVKVKHA